MQRLDGLFKEKHLEQKSDLVVGLRILLDLIEDPQALQVQPLVIKDPGMVQLLMQLEVDVLVIPDQPERGMAVIREFIERR